MDFIVAIPTPEQKNWTENAKDRETCSIHNVYLVYNISSQVIRTIL